MKTEDQRNPELARLAELIEPMRVAMLSNVDDDGSIVSRPMAPLELDADGALWFYTDLRSSKVEHLRTVNLAFADPDRAIYVSLSGHGEIDVDRGRIESLWTAWAKPWFPDGPQSPNLALLKFVPHAGEIWDAPHSRMVRLFAMAASAVAGKPIGLGQHETLDSLPTQRH